MEKLPEVYAYLKNAMEMYDEHDQLHLGMLNSMT